MPLQVSSKRYQQCGLSSFVSLVCDMFRWLHCICFSWNGLFWSQSKSSYCSFRNSTGPCKFKRERWDFFVILLTWLSRVVILSDIDSLFGYAYRQKLRFNFVQNLVQVAFAKVNNNYTMYFNCKISFGDWHIQNNKNQGKILCRWLDYMYKNTTVKYITLIYFPQSFLQGLMAKLEYGFCCIVFVGSHDPQMFDQPALKCSCLMHCPLPFYVPYTTCSTWQCIENNYFYANIWIRHCLSNLLRVFALQGYWTVNFTPDNPGYLRQVQINWLNFTVTTKNILF